MVYPACLPPINFRSDRTVYTTQSEQKNGTICTVSGWGKTEGKGDNTRLQSATIPIMERSQCNSLLGKNDRGSYYLPDDRSLCAGYLNGGIDACHVSLIFILDLCCYSNYY